MSHKYQIHPVSSALLAASASKALTILYNYDDTLTDSDPGSGNIRFNSATLGSITEAYLDDEDISATDKQGLFSNLSMHTFNDSCQSGMRILNSFLILLLSSRLNPGLAALDKPYSSVLTGITWHDIPE